MRGVVDAEGHSPFWDAIGRHFFKMSFEDADRLSARTDNQFILDLMPAYPIYVDLLSPAARAVIGQCHVQGEGAYRLLQWEGFRFSNVVDIFDGGPLMSAPRDTIRTLREAQRASLKVVDKLNAPRRALISTGTVKNFVCVPGLAEHQDGAFAVTRATLAALGVEDGAPGLVWMEPDAR
jgi:arginine N-succinyltransferase